jgi:hypothetical protein
MPINFFQRVGDFFEQKKAYRQAALIALRKRESLPSPCDQDGNELETRFNDQGQAYYVSPDGIRVERVMFSGAGKDGKPGALATGIRKGQPRELAEQDWHRNDGQFEILEVAEDGRKLADELRDLDRDVTGVEVAGRVSHGAVEEQAPGLVVREGADDDELDEVLQKFLKQGL